MLCESKVKCLVIGTAANVTVCGQSDELRSRLSWASNAEFAQAVIEGCAINAEARGSSVWAADHPVQFPQYAKNVIALDGFEGCRSVRVIWHFVRMLQFGKRYLETGAAG